MGISEEVIQALPEDKRQAVRDHAELMRDVGDMSKLIPQLQTWVEYREDSTLGDFMLRHPLVYSIIGSILPHQCNEMYWKKCALIREYVRAKDWRSWLMAHERPYRMHFLKTYLWDKSRISVEELRELLAYFWTDTETPEANQADPLWLFQEADFTTDDPEGWAALPEILTLYRGVDGVCELTPNGPSWTLDRKVAEFFAKRYAIGALYRIQASKVEALAYFTGRSEAEVILDLTDPMNSDRVVLDADYREEA